MPRFLAFLPLRRGAVALSGALLAGCMAPTIPDLPDRTPAAWTEPRPAAAPPVALRAWWKALRDPALDALVDQALAHNLDIAQAAGRLRRERIIAARSQARFQPSFSAGARTVQNVSATDTYFQASIDMVWELGLFGAAESARLAGAAEVRAAQAREQGVRVAVVADVVRNYLDLGNARRQAALLARMQALDERALVLAQERVRAHLGTPDEGAQAVLRAAQTRAEQALVGEAADRAARALSVLLGRDAPDPVWRQAAPPAMAPSFSLAQVPADLLRTRPDIQAAEAGVLRAAAALGMARSALYPRLALGGSLLYAYNITQNVRTTSDKAPAVGPVIDIPLWDWGLRRAQARAGEQDLDTALTGYRKAVLDGVAETEDALAALARQGERAAALEEVRRTLDGRLQAHRTLAGLGLASEFDGLAGRRADLQAQADLATAQAAQALAFVALYKALGGAPLPAPEAAP
ncbi:efflux transporter outer membrane subunit [Pigmentiphaga soli]|uniref:Efflux transporter outer membrane subunit n=1 Tax=Pigmentiphaga soli TaxID=1007095 RepID=A0ABP8H9K5_9BURK